MITADRIDQLDAAQAVENDGRGISCVRQMVRWLRENCWQEALSTRQHEGDKSVAYPKVEAILFDIFGCRLHGSTQCKVCK